MRRTTLHAVALHTVVLQNPIFGTHAVQKGGEKKNLRAPYTTNASFRTVLFLDMFLSDTPKPYILLLLLNTRNPYFRTPPRRMAGLGFLPGGSGVFPSHWPRPRPHRRGQQLYYPRGRGEAGRGRPRGPPRRPSRYGDASLVACRYRGGGDWAFRAVGVPPARRNTPSSFSSFFFGPF